MAGRARRRTRSFSDAISALRLCAPARVATLLVEGRVVVEGGELRKLSLERILSRHRRLAAQLVGRGSGASGSGLGFGTARGQAGNNRD
jgi:hypothetical protein